jgi:hypothetical protein
MLRLVCRGLANLCCFNGGEEFPVSAESVVKDNGANLLLSAWNTGQHSELPGDGQGNIWMENGRAKKQFSAKTQS